MLDFLLVPTTIHLPDELLAEVDMRAEELMRENPHVVTKIRDCRRQDIAISRRVVAELEFGLAMLPRGRRKTTVQERWQVVSRELL